MDDSIQDLINGMAGHIQLLDDVMKLAAKDLVYFVVPLALALWFLPGTSGQRSLRQRVAVVVVLGILLALGAAFIAGQVHAQSRPFISDGSTRLLISHSPDNSFPSDHATVSFAVAGTLICWRRLIGMVTLVVATLIGFARVFVGLHWPSDILAGAAIGIASGAIMAQTIPWWTWIQRRAAVLLPGWLVARP